MVPFLLKDLNPNLSVLLSYFSNSFYVCKNGNFFQCVAKKKFWYFVGCSQKVLLGSTKKGNFLKRKELTFLFSFFFLLRILAIHQNPFSFPLAAFLFFFLSQLLKLLWLILIKQVVFEFYMLQHEIVQFYAALQQQQAMERDTAHNKKISTLIVIYNRALQAKRLHWKRKGVS